MSELRAVWRESKVYRVLLVLAILYAVLRLGVQGYYLATMLTPEALPEWVGADEPMVPADLQIYLNAAKSLIDRQPLYTTAERIEVFQYSPSYALAFVLFNYFSPSTNVIIHLLFHILAYSFLYIWWKRIFRKPNLLQSRRMLVWTLPVWLIFSAFWGDLGYLNIYIIMALLATLLIDSILDERLGWSLFWLAIILQTKPQWAFAAAVPLLLGRNRFFGKLVIGAVITYIAIACTTMLIVGPQYGWQQYLNYFQFLSDMPSNFPWRGTEASFLGYNHSIKQIIIYLVGISPRAFQLATAVKISLLLPLGYVALRYLLKAPRDKTNSYQLSLDWAFVLYLGAFIWLDMVWEVSLGIVIFPYLLATTENRYLKAMLWVVFLPYALVDLWQVFSFVIFGMDVIAPGPYILTDPSIYLPLIMFVILAFYGLLLKRLWDTSTPLLTRKAI